jgi:hypothetical protein
MVKSALGEAKMKKLEPMELFATALELSTMVNDYIHDGKVVAILAKSDDSDDGLTPPNV